MEKNLKVGVVGGFGLMASPMSVHWKSGGPVKVARVHDRGTSGARHEKIRAEWRNHGAKLVSTFSDLVGDGELDGYFVCCGKNGDDLPILRDLITQQARKKTKSVGFLCHLSTVSTHFVREAHAFSAKHGIEYVNFPLTGGPLGAERGTMLILASGEPKIFERLQPALSLLGKPKYFGPEVERGAQVKLMGHMMVFNGLMGICSAVASHSQIFQNGKVGGEGQAEFFDFLNSGAGGTRQWEVIVASAIRQQVWQGPFYLKHAAVDCLYTIQMAEQLGLSQVVSESLLQVALAFSFVMNTRGIDAGTQGILREFLGQNRRDLDAFVMRHSAPRGEIRAGLERCLESFPGSVRETAALGELRF